MNINRGRTYEIMKENGNYKSELEINYNEGECEREQRERKKKLTD